MEVSRRTFVRKKLNSICDDHISRKRFYIGVCSWNDKSLGLKNFTEVVEFLWNAKDEDYRKLHKTITNE